MAHLNGFNANTVEPSANFEPIPAGKYLAIINDSQMKDTKKGGGRFLELTFDVIDGEFKGRKLWTRLNLENPNPLTVKIAQGELSSICRALGVMTPNDSVELHGLPLVITVKLKKREDSSEMTNEIKGYGKKDATSGKPQQASTSAPPWARK
ncbi:MAG: DUF669 domain-containing protein [Planctomycetes bacterium]|nr:DUF669 domain-containing protein [Planctomycetota bacterium]